MRVLERSQTKNLCLKFDHLNLVLMIPPIFPVNLTGLKSTHFPHEWVAAGG